MTPPNSPDSDESPAKRRGAERYAKVYDQANNYQETVHTLLAFAALVCHDRLARRPGSQFGFGRNMQTSAANPVSANVTVTPDCVAQMSPTYGIAAEVKKGIPKDQSHWADIATQFRKYDDALQGWWTANERIALSDAVLLLHQSRGRAFARLLNSMREADANSVGSHSALVEYNRVTEGKSYINFRIEWGALRDPTLQAQLDDGVQVPLQKVLNSFASVRFYDSKPPLEDLMKTLWIDWLANFDPTNPTISVVVSDLAAELQRAYGSQALHRDRRSPEFPRVQWVREALDMFVTLGLATSAGDGEHYSVKYRVFPQEPDLLERFCTLTANNRPRGETASQMTLFPASEDSSNGQ